MAVPIRKLKQGQLRSLAYGGMGIATAMGALAMYVRRKNDQIARFREKTREENKIVDDDRKAKRKDKAIPSLNKAFLRQLRKLLGICIPSIYSRQSFLLFAQLVVLYARTMASILVAKLDGYLVQAIVSKNFDKFFRGLGYWVALALPAVAVNSMIRYLTGQIWLRFRSALTEHVHDEYLKAQTYYKVKNLDSRVSNADQMITADVNQFTKALSQLYTDLVKPVMDLVLYSYTLYNSIGMSGPALLMGFYFLVGGVLRYSSPPFGQLTAEGGALEGVFRFCHSRLIQNSEEIAFYGGAEREKAILNYSYNQLRQHKENQLMLKLPYQLIEGFSLKYVASVLIYCINGYPIFFGAIGGITDKDRTGAYMESRKLLLDLSSAIQRVMEAYKEITELSGYTTRVCDMLDVFKDCQEGRYHKQIPDKNKPFLERCKNPRVKIGAKDGISFEHVPILTPNGDCLLEDLSLRITRDNDKPNMHLLITGPNGCGKSSLFRILGGLWPVRAGKLERPGTRDIFYIPQNCYLSLGTLQEQIIYPHSTEEWKANGGTLEKLAEIMEVCLLSYVVEREGWMARKNWKDHFSGGEKQRLGFARLFYHKPRFAILDECTSQTSVEAEGKMYQYARKVLGITLLTVSHRDSLWKYHTHVLQFDGQRGVELVSLKKKHRMDLTQEQGNLEHRLEEIPSEVTEIKARLQEIQAELEQQKGQRKGDASPVDEEEDEPEEGDESDGVDEY